jgi:hypothetical protein
VHEVAQVGLPFSYAGRVRGSCGRDVAIEGCRRHTKSMRYLSDADVGIGEQCSRGFKIVLCELWRTASSATGAPSGGEARLGTLPDQAASNSANAPNI